MQRNTGKQEAGRAGAVSVDTRRVRRVHTRKVPYRVGYSWNKGGRLKELRIRHLARKFLKIWMRNTFGRVPPHEAKFYYDSTLLRRAFEGWREEWWTNRREWSLTVRAECHHRYYLCNLVFQSWRMFTLLQREKKSKLQKAQLYADRQHVRLVWDRWEVFTEMRRLKKRMLESAVEQNRLATLHSTWNLWQTRLQHHQDLYTLEDQALKQQGLTLRKRTWLQWKEKHTASHCQKKKESTASLHFILMLKRKTFHQWMSYVSCCQTQRESQGKTQRLCCLRLVRMCWSTWRNALHCKWSDEHRLQAAGRLATKSAQRRTLERWKTYVMLCKDEAEINEMAIQHHQRHLLSSGLKGLYLNVILDKTHRLNSNIALQHYYQNTMRRFWKLWQEHLEEAEDKSFHLLTEKAQTYHCTSLLTSCFQSWKEKLAERRHMQELEHRANVWFAEHALPRCLNLWVEFTLQRRRHRLRRHEAEVYNQQRQYTWVFYTWWGRSERHKEQMLSERMAILHKERCHIQGAFDRWRQRTEQQINEKEKQKASDCLYRHQLLRKTMAQWKHNSTEIRDRRYREQQACQQGDLCCTKWALDRWKKFVQKQRVKKGKLEGMQHYHEAKLLKYTFVAWKTHHLQMSQIYGHIEELNRQKTQHLLRTALSVWRENAVLQAQDQLREQRAQNHFQQLLQLKVFIAWRELTACAVSKHHQQKAAVNRAQESINQVHQLQYFRQWRRQTREARVERMFMEKARRHYNSKLLSKALKLWNMHHYQCRKHKVMKRQGILLLKLKLYQTYFEQWRIKLQHRRREVEQTERALWHWSLTLQAKVLYGWRLWVSEQHRRQEQVASAAVVFRDQLLREGVTCILTYAAHMNDLTTSITQQRQEQGSRHLQRVVKRCAMRWKQRALCKPRSELSIRENTSKKTVTFCLTKPGLTLSDSAEQESKDGVLSKLLPTCMPRRQPRYELFESPLMVFPHEGTQNQFISVRNDTEAALKPLEFSSSHQSSHHRTAKVLVTSTHQSTIISTPSEPQVSRLDSSQGIQGRDLLLPPSAFMTTGSQNMMEKTVSLSCGEAPTVAPLKYNPMYPEIHMQASSEETQDYHREDVSTDPASALTRELLSIQIDMKSFQEDRKQLRAWQQLKEVLQSWLQTSGEDEQMEKNSVSQELMELEERINRLSANLTKRKPAMLQHAERIQHLKTALCSSTP